MGKGRGEEIFGLVEKIKPMLAHREPLVQSAVLAELLSMWLAGFHILGEAEATERMRAELLARHEVPEGEDWRNRFAEMLAVMDAEQLMRIRHRLGKRGWERTVKILSEEIAEREKNHGS